MIIKLIRKELKNNVDERYREDSRKFFKEPVKLLGVRTPIVRKISAKYFSTIKNNDKKDIFELCEKLLESGYYEGATIAFDWAHRCRKRYEKSDFHTFERWLKKYVSNWGSCDDFCTHALGYFLLKFPEFIQKIKSWAESENRWLRRASAVVLILPIRNKQYLDTIFEIAEKLLLDKDDLVQKGYGWMLKEASNIYQKEVFEFVMIRKNKMPRTALRYAIEKMPKEMRQKAMKRD